ncbi:hypothetical protein AALB47_02340 [Lachnospiraceae bacterium 54-11]
MKKIIITTTFRDFNGNINDKMQIQFLKSLKRQTYQNYVLVVTLFREKNVEATVKKILGEKAVFVCSTISSKYRYSPTKVIMSGIDYGKEAGADILIDCSADIILQNNFLQTVVNYYSSMYCGISHPNIFYGINNKFEIVDKRVGECNRGIDIRFFDFSLIANKNVCRILKKYTLFDWGGIEHLLAVICMKYSKRMINIFDESKVIKFENDREASKESKEYITRSSQKNSKVLLDVAQAMKIDESKLFDLYYIHLQYSEPRYVSAIYILRKELWRKVMYFYGKLKNV